MQSRKIKIRLLVMQRKAIMACVRCRALHVRCDADCIYRPLFGAGSEAEFDLLRERYGPMLGKLINDVQPETREAYVKTLIVEAQARRDDPVFGITGVLRDLQNRFQDTHDQLADVQAQLDAKTEAQKTIQTFPVLDSEVCESSRGKTTLEKELEDATQYQNLEDCELKHEKELEKKDTELDDMKHLMDDKEVEELIEGMD